MDQLASEVDQMLDNMQLDMIRQFQIQNDGINNLLSKYMIDEESLLQRDKPLNQKYFNMSAEDEQMDEDESEEEGQPPDFVYMLAYDYDEDY